MIKQIYFEGIAFHDKMQKAQAENHKFTQSPAQPNRKLPRMRLFFQEKLRLTR